MKVYLYLSRIISLVFDLFTVAYFVWLKRLLPDFAVYAVPVACGALIINWLIAEAVWDKYKAKHEVKETKAEKIVDAVCSAPVYAVMSPAILVSYLESHGKYDMKKRFKFLIRRGYCWQEIEYASYFKKGDVVIKILQDYEYKISYDGGKTFVNVADTQFGTQYERDELKRVMAEYANASLDDKRSGKTVDTAYYFVKFMRLYIR